jgi:hypothetical protein
MARNPLISDGLHQFDDRLYRLIGKIVVTFNSLEALLRECVAGALGDDPDLSVVVLSRVSFSELLEIFKITSRVAFQVHSDSEQLQKTVSDLAAEMKEVNDRRNLVVHSHYGELFRIQATDDGEVYETETLIRTKVQRKLDHFLDPDLASEEIQSFNQLESDLERLKKAYSDLNKLSGHLIKSVEMDLGTAVR